MEDPPFFLGYPSGSTLFFTAEHKAIGLWLEHPK
jgi:hypothetical protein